MAHRLKIDKKYYLLDNELKSKKITNDEDDNSNSVNN